MKFDIDFNTEKSKEKLFYEKYKYILLGVAIILAGFQGKKI